MNILMVALRMETLCELHTANRATVGKYNATLRKVAIKHKFKNLFSWIRRQCPQITRGQLNSLNIEFVVDREEREHRYFFRGQSHMQLLLESHSNPNSFNPSFVSPPPQFLDPVIPNNV